MLRYYQEEAIQSVFRYFEQNSGNPIIAMPTGTGKSLVIAGLIQTVMGIWPNQRFLISVHVKELVKHDLEKLLEIWPNAPVGVYSAGLHKKQTGYPITFGSIQSLINSPDLGHIDLFIVDEGHLISDKDESQYQQLIAELRKVNPYVKVICLTATPFRLGLGMLTEGKIFTHICYDMTGVEAFNRLIDEGYLVPLIPPKLAIELDVMNVGIAKGDYKQGELQKAVNQAQITYECMETATRLAWDRRSWLIFASGIEHSDAIAQMLNYYGVKARSVHSRTSEEERDQAITDFKHGRIRALSNNNILTHGFDYPALDCIICMRPTISPVLWTQMLGRGTRPAEGKRNCLVLDFAGNTTRLGPINDPVIPSPKRKVKGQVPIKICQVCECYNHISVRFCINCGAEFEFQIKIEEQVSEQELIKKLPIVEAFDVLHVDYRKHISRKTETPCIKASYLCNNGLNLFHEFKFPESKNYAGKVFRDWWRFRHFSEPPETTQEASAYFPQLRSPKRIKVHINKKYPEIIGYEW